MVRGIDTSPRSPKEYHLGDYPDQTGLLATFPWLLIDTGRHRPLWAVPAYTEGLVLLRKQVKPASQRKPVRTAPVWMVPVIMTLSDGRWHCHVSQTHPFSHEVLLFMVFIIAIESQWKQISKYTNSEINKKGHGCVRIPLTERLFLMRARIAFPSPPKITLTDILLMHYAWKKIKFCFI